MLTPLALERSRSDSICFELFFFGFQVIAREQSIDLHRVSAFGVRSVFPQLAMGREAVTDVSRACIASLLRS